MQNLFEWAILILVFFIIVWVGTRIVRNLAETWKTLTEGKKLFSRLKQKRKQIAPDFLSIPNTDGIVSVGPSEKPDNIQKNEHQTCQSTSDFQVEGTEKKT